MTRAVLCVVGTRPEAIKMAPVVLRLRASPGFRVRLLATAQHRQMLDQALAPFALRPDIDLDLMRPDQSLTDLTARMLMRLGPVLSAEAPDIVLAQGDTTTVLATALACFHARIPFGHIEAGLRTGSLDNPFPEELNRVLTAQMARWHFAPTARAAAPLVAEGRDPASVHVTGNTVIDALRLVAGRAPPLPVAIDPGRRLILATLHRRENFGAPLERILVALSAIVRDNLDTELLIPVHQNPNVHRVIEARLAGRDRVRLTGPLGYGEFVAAMLRAHLILSDSGGVQEEAPALGRPVLVLRDTTERPEAADAGATELVGTATDRIRACAQRLLDDPAAHARMAAAGSPYGDGRAAERIAGVLAADDLRAAAA
ncbi:MAG: non-hydrolyzing UDP-N-acetylglucosamine 2-epimerase [Paracoccaceae bacterium]